MKTRTPIFTFFVAVILLTSALNAKNRVTIRAEATKDYIDARAEAGSPGVQTYQVMKGRYFPGDLQRNSMDSFTFEELLRSLAGSLQKQNFLPDPDYGEGDLVLVVHYGVTHAQGLISEKWGFANMLEMGYLSVPNETFMEDPTSWYKNISPLSINFKARLLGMEEVFDWRKGFGRDKLIIMLDEPRFFVVVMAYDLPLAKEGTLKLHWMTRYSIRATGQAYPQAVHYLNEVAGDYHGMNFEGLQRQFPVSRAEVEVGEIEVLELDPKVLDFEYFQQRVQ